MLAEQTVDTMARDSPYPVAPGDFPGPLATQGRAAQQVAGGAGHNLLAGELGGADELVLGPADDGLQPANDPLDAFANAQGNPISSRAAWRAGPTPIPRA